VTQTSNLSPNAQAVLLLCGQGGAGGVPPLTPGIYNKLAFWLKERVLEPAHLMEAEALALYEREPLPEVPADRLRALMGQGLGVALLVEEWQRQGGWVLCRADGAYPGRLREVLKLNAPLLLYGIGPVEILSQPGIAVVGSRNLDEAGRQFAQRLGEACAQRELAVFTGGARGADEAAAEAVLESGGRAGLLLAGDLGRTALKKSWRIRLGQGVATLCSLTPPGARFSVGAAMGRNRAIYALSQATVVVASDLQTGGTWEGATENLRRWHVPVFVRDVPRPAGNQALIAKGALPFPSRALEDPRQLLEAAQPPAHGRPAEVVAAPQQLGLFGATE